MASPAASPIPNPTKPDFAQVDLTAARAEHSLQELRQHMDDFRHGCEAATRSLQSPFRAVRQLCAEEKQAVAKCYTQQRHDAVVECQASIAAFEECSLRAGTEARAMVDWASKQPRPPQPGEPPQLPPM